MARHRSFSFEFKRQVVLDFLEGRTELRGLARQHSLSRHLLRLWIQKYEAGQLNDEVADACACENPESNENSGGLTGRSVMSPACSRSSRRYFPGWLVGFAAGQNWNSNSSPFVIRLQSSIANVLAVCGRAPSIGWCGSGFTGCGRGASK